MIASLSDSHTRLLEPKQAQAILSGDMDPGQVPTGGVDGDIGTVLVPGVLTALDSDAGERYVDAARAVLRPGPCGWIVDVRGNTGGDIGPMLAAVAPLLGSGPALQYRYRDGATSTFIITGGGGLQADDRGKVVDIPARPVPFEPLPTGTPVAVLHDHETASSGEGIVMAFRGRAHVRTFGTPTFGVPTGVAGHELADGSVLAITETIGVDATGTSHTGPIPPDETITPGVPDPTVDAARNWLTRQPSCVS
jgi:C-terminal processing protease CtpA/Prc